MNIIEQLHTAHEASTPGKWVLSTRRNNPMVFVDGQPIFGGSFCDYFEPSNDDYEFFVKAHNAMPVLLEAVEELLKIVEGFASTTAFNEYTDTYYYVCCGASVGNPHDRDCQANNILTKFKNLEGLT